jgi:ribosomal protein L14
MTTTSALQLTVSAGVSPARLDALTRDLARDLTRSGAFKAKPIEVQAGPGERGVAAKIGELLLEAIGGAGLKTVAETAKVLGEVLKAYLVREKTLKIELTLPDGTKVVLDAKNMSVSAIESALAALRRPA